MEALDFYCERTDPGFWAEPLNATSNIAFLVAAFAFWKLLQHSKNPDFRLKPLPWMIGSIGIGSGLFHTFATPATSLLDIIPIACFVIYVTAIYARHVLHLRLVYVALLLGCLGVIGIVSFQFHFVLNGSLAYLPALTGMIVLAAIRWSRTHERPDDLLLTAGLFAISLTFRTADNVLCAAFPLGTHFMWHLLNAIVAYLVSRSAWKNWVD